MEREALKWKKEHPEWKLHGYGYATPCCLSKQLLAESKQLFTTFVHNYDAVSRLSMGSIEDLHNGMRLFVNEVGKNHNIFLVFQGLRKLIMNSVKNDNFTSVACKIHEIIYSQITEEFQHNFTPSHLFPPGQIFQLWRENRGKHSTVWEIYQVIHLIFLLLKIHSI